MKLGHSSSRLAVPALLASLASAQFPYVVEELHPTGHGITYPLVEWNGRVAFSGITPNEGAELWVSDGTAAGTYLVKDIAPGPSWSFIRKTTWQMDSILYFLARDDVHGEELWRSDGTTQGTFMVYDFSPGSAFSSGTFVHVSNGKLIIYTASSNEGGEIWVSDGTTAGTSMLTTMQPGPASSAQSPIVWGDTLFFVGTDVATGDELWRTDGTVAGTYLVKDFNPGPGDGAGKLLDMHHGSNFFLTARDGTHGYELWATDGILGGNAQMLVDANPGAGNTSVVDSFGWAALANGVIFNMDAAPFGEEPWISDGTVGGTFMLGDLQPGTEDSRPVLVAIDSSKAFFAASSPSTGYEPWLTDGTSPGTFVAEIVPGPTNGVVFTNQPFAGGGGMAYFLSSTVGGFELARSDGTLAGTLTIKDFAGAPSIFGPLLPVDDFLLFTRAGQTIYSNGFADTTHVMPEDPSGERLTAIAEAVRVGNRLFLRGTGDTVGNELFALDLDDDDDGTIEFFDALNVTIECLCPAPLAPCGNDDATAGCANSTGAGAKLAGLGSTVLDDDDLVLTTTQLPPLANGVMFMGKSALSSIPFLDGIRCVGGATVRWPVQNAGPSGTISYGPGLAALSQAFSPAFHFSPGMTMRFQTWYRNPAGPCGLGSNLSSSATVIFTP